MTVPEQTPIHITLDQAVSSDQNISGDHFQATVTEPVDVNGKTVIPQGAHVEGLIVDARKSGRLMGRAQLRLVLDAVQLMARPMTCALEPPYVLAATTRNATSPGSAVALPVAH